MFHAGGTLRAGPRPRLRTDPSGRRTHRLGIVDLPPRIVARGPARIGRAQRAGTVDFPGRRQRRKRLRAAAGRARRHSLRPDLDHVVRPGRTAGHRHPPPHRQLVQTATERRDRRTGNRNSRSSRIAPPQDPPCAADPHGAGFLEIFLHRLYDQLFHLLPYGQIRLLGAGRAIQPLRIPRGIGRRHGHRRAAGRPHRTEIRHLGVDSRSGTLRPDAAPTPDRAVPWRWRSSSD